MAVHRSSFLAVVLLLASLDLRCSSSSPPCPKSCTCQRASLLNCSSSGLSSVPQVIQDSITELDLSHNLLSSLTFNQPHPSLKTLWLGNNSIQYLSLCIERKVRGRQRRLRSETGNGSRCLTWAPALQLLSAERNLLEQLPEGLDTIRSLQVLQLSFNRISNLEPGILGDLHQLRELHLQHNFITHLHPHLFQNLDQLRVLDLSFNMLTNMQQLTYLTLRNIGTDVKLSGNRWRCDCNTRNLKRQMTYDTTKGLQAWNIICDFPSTVLGKDLLQLNEEDLKCLSTENHLNLHQDVTVYSGAEILLFCSAQESAWWTPSGRASVDQHEAHLHIRGFSEGDAGLYVCVSEEDQVLSVFNLQISKTTEARKVRSLPMVYGQTALQKSTNKTSSITSHDLALGVCLSILFTFLLAFILGVLARPCIDRLWRRVSKKEARHETHAATSVQQGQYENHAFSHGEEPEIEHHRERRVTFSSVEFTEESNVQYYDTVASGNLESFRSNELSQYQEEDDLHKYPKDKQGDDSSSEELAAERLRNMKFEPIPDPDELEERRSISSSSSSNSSQNASEANQMTRDHTKPKSLQLVEESLKRADFSKTTKTKIPLNRSSSPQTNKTNPAGSEDSQDDEEQFEFSDGAQSPSNKTSSLPVSFSSNVHQVKNSYDSKRPGETQDNSFSSDSSCSDKDPTQTKIKQRTEKKRRKVAPKLKPATHSSFSDSESEENVSYVNVKSRSKTLKHPFQKSKTTVYDSDGSWPAVDLEHIPHLKRRLDIKALLRSSGSTSCRDSDNEKNDYMTQQKQATLNISNIPDTVYQNAESGWPSIDFGKISRIKRRLDIKAPKAQSDSSPSSDSEYEIRGRMIKQKQVVTSQLPTTVSPKVSSEPEGRWRTPDFEKTTVFKKRLDIKAPSTDSNSSSSIDSDDERRDYVRKEKQDEFSIYKVPADKTKGSQKPVNHWPELDGGWMVVSQLPTNVSSTIRPKPENRLPPPDLAKTEFKKPLDIKAPLTDSDSSSASDSDNETKYHSAKQKQDELPIVNLSANRTAESQKPANYWPTLDFGRVTMIKRRLDIKAPKAHSDSPSSSDNDDETRGHVMNNQQKESMVPKVPTKISPEVRPKPANRWPSPDLVKTTVYKKPQDITALSTYSDSSSASDSDNESQEHVRKGRHEDLPILTAPFNIKRGSQKPANQWPALDLGKVTKIKRRLDIKTPRAYSDSSSSSDSEDETRGYQMKQKQDELMMSKFPTKVSPTLRPLPEDRRPPPDLGTTQFKKPLDTNAPSTDSDSCSASDSDNETKYHMAKQKQDKLPIVHFSANRTTESQKPANYWPTLDFGRVTKIKRRLDIKAPRAHSHSSSSSDSEDETRGYLMKQKQDELVMSKFPTKVSPTLRPLPEDHWPPPDLERTQFRKPIDTNAPSTDSDSSSATDSGNETKYQSAKQKQDELPIANLSANRTAESQKPANYWPTLDFGRVTKIKRHLDIKAPRAHSNSSSSSDNDDETRGHRMNHHQEELMMTKVPTKVSPHVRPKLENRWPPLDLDKNTVYKKPQDITEPSTDSDSSSASDSDNESQEHMRKGRHEELPILTVQLNTTGASQKQANHWPALDFGKVTKIKRRLDIKAPRAHSHSSSSSDSEDEKRGYLVKQKQDKLVVSKFPTKVSPTLRPLPEDHWPPPDLERTQFRKPIDTNAPSTDSDSSSATDSDNETKYHTAKQKQDELPIPNLSANRTAESQKPANYWPTLDFGRVTKIKRRLDIKAPRAHSDSSSSSNSDDETRGHRMNHHQEELMMSKVPTNVSPHVRPKLENRWPPLDLDKNTVYKKPQNITAPSTDSDSSSASDSDNESQEHMRKGRHEELPILTVQFNTTGASQKPANQWPALDFGKVTKIKRHLDIKAPQAHSHSSSSSDSEDETRGYLIKQKQDERSKPPTDSELSSGSDNDDNRQAHMIKQNQEQLHTSQNPLPTSQNPTGQMASQNQGNQWPSLDLWKVTHFKKRLDIKAPTADSDVSFAIGNHNETEYQMTKHKQEEFPILKVPVNISTASQNPANQWPVLDLGKVTRIKRRLDIKAPRTNSESSSNDSEDEIRSHVIKQKQEQLVMATLPTKVSPTVRPKPENRWPPSELEKNTTFNRPLDIKATSTDSDSSSDSETTDHTAQPKQEELHFSRNLLKTGQMPSQHQGNQWPSLDLWRVTRFKKRLDIKAPTADSDSSSASDSENETKDHMTKQRQNDFPILNVPVSITTVIQKPVNQEPILDLGKIMTKRQLDIKPSDLDSSSSSDSGDDKEDNMIKQKQEEFYISKNPLKTSQTPSQKLENQWPSIDLWRVTRFKKRLDIKAPTPQLDSPASGANETSPLTEIMKPVVFEAPHLSFQGTTTKGFDPDGQRPAINIYKLPHVKRRLDIKAPSPNSGSSSSSDSESETKGHVIKQKQEDLQTSKPPPEVPLTVSPKPENKWPALDLKQTASIKRRLDIKASVPHLSSSGRNESVGMSIDPTIKADRDRGHEGVNQSFNRHVDSKYIPLRLNSSSYMGSKKSESQSSSSESEDDNRNHKAKLGKDKSFISTVSEKTFIRPQTFQWKNMSYSPKTDQNIRLEKYTVISDDDKKKPTNDTSRTTVEVDPELQSRWATMNLGVSRFRKHLEITSNATEPLDVRSPPPPDSPISTSSESGSGRRQRMKKKVGRIQEIMRRGSSPVLETYQVNPSPPLTESNDRFTFSDVIQQRINEKHSPGDNKDLTTLPKESSDSSSSSESEDETKVHRVTDLSSGIPRIRRRLDIKAPSQELGNTPPFFSQNENLTRHNMVHNRQVSTNLETTDESLISYKRSIFKSSIPKGSFTSGASQTFGVISNLSQEGSNEIDASLNQKSASNTSFDDIVQMKLGQSRPKTDGDLSTTLQLSNKSDATLIHKYQSVGPELAASLSSDIFHGIGNSSQKKNETLTAALGVKRGRIGLSALKVMSEERRHWEKLDKDTAPLFDAQDGGLYSQSQSEKDIEVFSQQSQIHSPSDSETKKELDLLLLYGVPRYQRHSSGDSSRDILLPDQATPKPDE